MKILHIRKMDRDNVYGINGQAFAYKYVGQVNCSTDSTQASFFYGETPDVVVDAAQRDGHEIDFVEVVDAGTKAPGHDSLLNGKFSIASRQRNE